ncbi:hypothetical protein [Aquicoccus porphyridii]|uniref:Uncharacterized protein n=1 Tax=Aquicoccus porphyridii TaxID=1852029 RepID=A0A5A9Z628_9RHOB|nr:hypothetical protein [Aquicoccus porphyridii]KAA0912415.1 hypothetical protein FLO80_15225 [Aquicoccus porphyridii]RAI53097.1 hypothetical protein DOO74_14530 [Rhodobacteraceae bacterium AsT-22]
MDRDEALSRRGDLIEERTTEYIRRAKRMVLDVFGIEAAKEQSTLTLQLATAMIHLEAAELNAASLRRIARTLEQKDG